MGINIEKDIEANLQIGPTDQGMVRIFVTAGDAESRWTLKLTKPMILQKK